VIPVLFVAFAAILIGAGLMVVLHRNPVTSALFLVVAFCALAGIYILMRAEFIGMVQVIVYAGAIMVLFLFVIMYLNLGRDPEAGAAVLLRRAIGWLAGALVVATGALLFAGRWALGPMSAQPVPPGVGNTQALGEALYTRFLFPFEITSLVLLVAMVGAIVISRGHRVTPEPEALRQSRTPAAPVASRALQPGDSLTPMEPRS
jgi:NADH-quinone oxidoreductase subunit J